MKDRQNRTREIIPQKSERSLIERRWASCVLDDSFDLFVDGFFPNSWKTAQVTSVKGKMQLT